jgi:hypothetical protein
MSSTPLGRPPTTSPSPVFEPIFVDSVFHLFSLKMAEIMSFISAKGAKKWVLRQKVAADALSIEYLVSTVLVPSSKEEIAVERLKQKQKALRLKEAYFLGRGAHGHVYRREKRGHYFVKKTSYVKDPTLLPICLRNALREFLVFPQLHNAAGQTYRFVIEKYSGRWCTRMTLLYLGEFNFSRFLRRDLGLNSDPSGWFRYFAQACLTLFFLHSFKIAHLDIKPANAVISDSSPGGFLLADFGSCLFEEEFKQNETMKKTTLSYRPIEALKSPYLQNHGYWTDVYSIAVFFLNLLGLESEDFHSSNEEGGPCDMTAIEKLFADFFHKKFEEDFLVSKAFPPAMVKDLSRLLKSMVAFYGEDRFSHLYLRTVGLYFLRISEAFSVRSDALLTLECPHEIKAEIERSELAIKSRGAKEAETAGGGSSATFNTASLLVGAAAVPSVRPSKRVKSSESVEASAL